MDHRDVAPETWVWLTGVTTGRCVIFFCFTFSTKITLNVTPFHYWGLEQHCTEHSNTEIHTTPHHTPEWQTQADTMTLCCKHVRDKISCVKFLRLYFRSKDVGLFLNWFIWVWHVYILKHVEIKMHWSVNGPAITKPCYAAKHQHFLLFLMRDYKCGEEGVMGWWAWDETYVHSLNQIRDIIQHGIYHRALGHKCNQNLQKCILNQDWKP